MDFPVNRAEATLRGSRTAWGFENDDEMSAALGYEGELMGVFRGRVGIVEADVTTVRVVGVGSTWRLVNQKVNRLYEKQTAGAIVSDLAASADVYTAEVQAGFEMRVSRLLHRRRQTHLQEIRRQGNPCVGIR